MFLRFFDSASESRRNINENCTDRSSLKTVYLKFEEEYNDKFLCIGRLTSVVHHAHYNVCEVNFSIEPTCKSKFLECLL